MLDPALYIGREQTYVKHFFLKQYLERVAYNISLVPGRLCLCRWLLRALEVGG